MLVRRIARPLLASTFIFGGLDALRNPASKAPAAAKLDIPRKPGMDKLNISSTEQAVKVNAAAQVAGGSLLAFGRFPRVAALVLAGSIVPTTLAGHRFWEEADSAKKQGQLLHFLKNASMLGGLLLAAVDTAGKESLAHKTTRVTKRSKRKAAKATAKATAKASKKQAAAAQKVRDVLPG